MGSVSTDPHNLLTLTLTLTLTLALTLTLTLTLTLNLTLNLTSYSLSVKCRGPAAGIDNQHAGRNGWHTSQFEANLKVRTSQRT